jgi:hypothetical protein
MTKQFFNKHFWVFSMSLLLVFVLIPEDSFSQNRRQQRAGKSVYAKTDARSTTAKRSHTSKRVYNRATNSNRATANRSYSRAESRVTHSNRRSVRTKTQPTNRYNARVARENSRKNLSRAERAGTRYNTGRATAPTNNYTYTRNQRNDYCNEYYRNQNTWNRSFWTSIHYTPTYYDLMYNRFPTANGLSAQRIRYLGKRYWFYDGIWFRKRFGRYYAVDAPIGLCIDYLPIGGEMIWYRGDRYVMYRGTTYKMLPFGGFQVVQVIRRF